MSSQIKKKKKKCYFISSSDFPLKMASTVCTLAPKVTVLPLEMVCFTHWFKKKKKRKRERQKEK